MVGRRQVGKRAAQHRRELEPVARETATDHDVGKLWMPIDDEVPVGRDCVQARRMPRGLWADSGKAGSQEVCDWPNVGVMKFAIDE